MTSSAHASTTPSPSQAWKTPSASVHQDPAAIVRSAPRGKALEVVVTEVTAQGPRVTTTPVADPGKAEALIAQAQSKRSTVAVAMAQPVAANVLVNDTRRVGQWALNLLSAESLWNTVTGSGVTVAVLDTGVRGSHTDLSNRVLSGYDVVTDKTGGNFDTHGHGTHVAGIIAANAGNGKGIAGIAGFAPRVKILPIGVANRYGGSNSGYLAEGVVWAANHGAKVINISMGGSGRDDNLNAAIQYAVKQRNVVVVAAAGNTRQSGNQTHYPAAFPDVIGVGATDSSNRIGSFSNAGSYVDVVAPGVSILSTYLSPTYAKMTGTSMATPYVSATAALAIQAKGLLGYNATTLSNDIAATAKDLGSMGRDDYYGYGLVSPKSVVALARGQRLATAMSLSVPTATMTSGGTLAVGMRLRSTAGANLIGVPVKAKVVFDGKTMTQDLITSRTGYVKPSFPITANAVVTFSYAGDSRTAAVTKSATYAKVKPRTGVSRSGSKVVVTNYNLFGQIVRVQRLDGSGVWRTVAEKRATEHTWNVTLRSRGKHRVRTSPTSRVIVSVPATWTWS